MSTTTATTTNPYSSSTTKTTSTTNNAFKYDRRGFDVILQSLLVCIVLSTLILIFYNWKIGLLLLLVSCIYFITFEAISARPDNNPVTFVQWRQRRDSGSNCPVLLCIGDSLTHGNCSSSYASEIPYQLSLKLGLPIPPATQTFGEPIYVVNGGQNSITSHTVLYERFLPYINTIRPDYILLLIGTNDVQATYSPSIIGKFIKYVNCLSSDQQPSIQKLEYNIQQMISYIVNDEVASPHVQFAICTLPPLGENLQSVSNQYIRQANKIIEKLVHDANCNRITLIPLYNELEKTIQEKKKVQLCLPFDIWYLVGLLMYPIYHISYGLISWNMISSCFNHVVLTDGLHLNEYGRDIFVTLIINEWLYKKNITKAIAVKKFH